jgi:hypothetical protein
MRGLRTVVLAGILLASGSGRTLRAAEPAASRPPAFPIPGGTGAGEVSFFDASGRHLSSLTGLVDPTHLAPTEGDRFLVTDRAAGRVLELDPDGRVYREIPCPPEMPHPDEASPLRDGHVLLRTDFAVAEIDGRGRVVWRPDKLPAGAILTGAARLADGSTILVTSLASASLLRAAAGSTRLEPVALDVLPQLRIWLRGGPGAFGASSFLVWNHELADVHRVTVQDGRASSVEMFRVWPTLSAVLDPSGGLVVLGDGFSVKHVQRDGTTVELPVPFAPLGAIFLLGRRQYAVSFVRVAGARWPETWQAGAARTRFPWPRLAIYALGGLAVVFFLAWVRGRPEAAAAASESPSTAEDAPPASRPQRAGDAILEIAPLLLFATSLFLAWRGVGKLDVWFHPDKDPPLIAGFALAAVAATWSRISRRQHDPFWRAVLSARPSRPALLRALGLGSLVLVAGLVVLFNWRTAGRETEATCLWAGLHVVLLGMTAIAFCGEVHLRALRAHAPLLIPLAAGGVTLFYLLLDVPSNTHFDFHFCSLSALELLQGRVASIFQTGFVPVPVFGLLPEMLGFVLAGPTELGFRLGPALAGLSGIPAVYILGTAYGGRRTGVLAAIFLAGAIPWIHFSRMSTTGVSAVAGLWLVTLFALALRSGHPGWWLASGSVAGWCFYLWPASRVSAAACFLGGLLLALRAPRATARRWFGPPLMALAFAVWLVPLLPNWIALPTLAMPRAQESLDAYKPGQGFNVPRIKAAFGAPLARSFGWFFSVPDQSSQGSMSPALNRTEAALFVAGLAVAVVAGFSLNVVLLIYLGLVLTTLGAFAGSPPWYTRMLPSLPIACVFMGHAAAMLVELLPLRAQRLRAAAFALLIVAALRLSPATNLPRYIRYEGTERPVWEATAVGRLLRDLGQGREIFLVETGRPDWSLRIQNERPPRLGEMLPFVWNLRMTEVRDLDDVLPLPPGPKLIVVPTSRVPMDLPRLEAAYPQAREESLPGVGGPWAKILLID